MDKRLRVCNMSLTGVLEKETGENHADAIFNSVYVSYHEANYMCWVTYVHSDKMGRVKNAPRFLAGKIRKLVPSFTEREKTIVEEGLGKRWY